MKKTFKKILAVMLAVVLLFGAAPLCKTDGILTTKASALETVSGSYDYLVNHLQSKGNETSSGSVGFVVKDGAITDWIQYYPSKDYVECCADIDLGTYDCQVIFKLKKTDSKSITIDTYKMDTRDISKIEHLHTTFDPQTYKYGTSMTYTIDKMTSTDKTYQKTIMQLSDNLIKMALESLDGAMKDKVGFGLGNFGFTNISEPAPIPREPGIIDTIVSYLIIIIAFVVSTFSTLIWFI